MAHSGMCTVRVRSSIHLWTLKLHTGQHVTLQLCHATCLSEVA